MGIFSLITHLVASFVASLKGIKQSPDNIVIGAFPIRFFTRQLLRTSCLCHLCPFWERARG